VTAPRFVIALVASAGGIDAVSTILPGLDPRLQATVLVVIHQSPERGGLLSEILQRHTELPVEAAVNGGALLPGHVVVAPPGHHLLVTPDDCTALIPVGEWPPNRPSADLLLTTLAIARRDRAIAVVLSGGGHDGATGASAVHEFGGTVLATDEASSTVFSMPAAAIRRDSAVDHVVALDDVAGLLGTLASATLVEPPDAGPTGESRA
jgi:two-component system, chemotaxis family, protein-glutamate methylesterase/glutaminase